MSDTNDSFAPIDAQKTNARPDATPGRERADTAKFATYNVLHGRLQQGPVDLAAFRTSVAALSADVVGLQEMDKRMVRTRFADMTADAARAINGESWFGPARRRFDLGLYGNSLVAKGSIERREIVRLPRHSWRYERRVGLVADVTIGDVTWATATTHLSFIADEARAQLQALLERLQSRSLPRVLMGDFNLRPEDVEPMAVRNGWEVVPTGDTYASWEPRIRIDFVLVQGAQVLNSEVVSLPVSDHCAVIAELRAVDVA